MTFTPVCFACTEYSASQSKDVKGNVAIPWLKKGKNYNRVSREPEHRGSQNEILDGAEKGSFNRCSGLAQGD